MISRRRLIASSASAIACGSAIGVVGSQMLSLQASLRAIGAGKSMLVLVDTGSERVLFVLGEPNEGLLRNAAGISTIGNQRIDVLVATHLVLASRAARESLPLESAHTLCLQSDMTLPPIQGVNDVVMDHATLGLGDRMQLSVWIDESARDEDALNQPSFSVGVARGKVSAVLLGSAKAKMPPSHSSPDVLVVPDAANADLTGKVSPSLLICNEGKRAVPVNQMQVFWNDPIRVELGTESISYRRDQLWS